jgi:hypothetical protein
MRGKCFLCGCRDSQAFRRAGGRMFYFVGHTKTGAVRRRYFCSTCEENRTAEIEAAYCQEEAKEESRLEAKRRKIEKGRVE